MYRIRRVLLVDDHPFIINGVTQMLSNIEELKIVAAVSNGREALQVLKKKVVDLIITDLEMPKMGGLELIEEVNVLFPDIKIIVLSMHDENYMINKLLKLNVAGIMPKSSNEEEFKSAISKIAIGGIYIHPTIVKGLNSGSSDIEYVTLTRKEIELVNYIYQGYTTKEIADKLNKSINTIETHRRNMFVKSGAKNTASLIKFGLENGYINT